MELLGFLLKSPRRPVHRPTFELLERRILPTTQLQVIPLATGQPYPQSLVPGADGDLWVIMKYGDEVDHIAADGTVTKIPLGPPTSGGFLSTLADLFNAATHGPDGNLWVSGIQDVDRVTPEGVVTTFANGGPDGWPTGNYSSSIVAGPDGALWFDGFDGSIGRITTDGTVTRDPLPDPRFAATSITVGPDSALWFTEYKSIGRLSTDGTFTMFPSTNGAYVDDITLGEDGNLWFVTANGNQIGQITPDGDQTYFTLPTASASATSLTAGPDGALWFTEPQGGRIGRITTDGQITEYPLPDASAPGSWSSFFPLDIAFGPDGSLWYSTSFNDPQEAPGTVGQGTDGSTYPHEIVHVPASDFASIDAQPAWTSPLILDGPVFAGTVATFLPVDPTEPASDFSSNIDWGDGSTSIGLVVPTDSGSYQVEGLHAYEEAGPFNVTVTMTAHPAALLPIVLPAVVEETVMVGDGAAAPVPGADAGSGDNSGPPILIMLPEIRFDALVPSVAPPAASDPVAASIDAMARPATTAPAVVSASTGVGSLVPLNPASSSSDVASGSGTVVPLVTAASTTSGTSTRAVKPVPTLGQASPKLGGGSGGGVRRGPKAASKPLRVARAAPVDNNVRITSLPEALPAASAR